MSKKLNQQKCKWCGKMFRVGYGVNSYKNKNIFSKILYVLIFEEFCSEKCCSAWEKSRDKK